MAEGQCIFCGIASKQIPSYTVYEDDKVIAFLDINPITTGHVLLIPKDHYPVIQAMPADVMDKMAIALRTISKSMIKGMQATGTNVFIASGASAGQKLPHAAVHIIPRYDNDTITSFFIQENNGEKEELEKIKEIFINKLKGVQKPKELSREEEENQIKETDLEAELTKKFNLHK